MTHTPRLVIVTVILAAAVGAAWWLGLLDGISALRHAEVLMLGFLAALFAVGQIAAIRGDWASVRHIANVLPAWGLVLTGGGLLLAISQLHSLTPEALSQVFRDLGYAISPNVVGVFGFACLKTQAWWAAHEEV